MYQAIIILHCMCVELWRLPGRPTVQVGFSTLGLPVPRKLPFSQPGWPDRLPVGCMLHMISVPTDSVRSTSVLGNLSLLGTDDGYGYSFWVPAAGAVAHLW